MYSLKYTNMHRCFLNYLVGRCYMWTVQMKTEKCQGYRWSAQHYHAGTHGQVGTGIL